MIAEGKFVFDSTATFDEFDNGTAHFYGSIVAAEDTNKKFTFNIWFEKKSANAGTGGPKKELNPGSYSDQKGPVDVATWYYYDFHSSKSSTLNGVQGTEYGDRTFNLYDWSEGENPAQIGVGANGKNDDMGLAVWIGYKEQGENPLESKRNSDINISLTPNPEPVPEPTTGLLIPTLVGLGWRSLSKRRNQLKKSNG
ncbi:MAG: hypothetical protein F6J93_40330 [Oscillatoria sp. SIO1A7]|nr:hypothetical protein [Oscillatoria sp. SIO1A7]